MEDLNKAAESLSTLKNVRIIHLPPFTFAARHYIGENPEENAEKQLEKFIKTSNLPQIKPDARVNVWEDCLRNTLITFTIWSLLYWHCKKRCAKLPSKGQ